MAKEVENFGLYEGRNLPPKERDARRSDLIGNKHFLRLEEFKRGEKPTINDNENWPIMKDLLTRLNNELASILPPNARIEYNITNVDLETKK